MTNKNGHFGRMEDFMPVRRSREEIMETILKSKDKQKEPRAVEVLKTFGALQLLRYRLASSALQDDLDAMKDKTQRPWNDKDYSDQVARYGIFDTELNAPLAVLTVHSERGNGPELTFVTRSPDNRVPGAEFAAILNELDLPPSKHMGTDHDMIRWCDLWFEDGVWSHRDPAFAVKVTFERTSYLTHPAMTEVVDVLLPEIDGKPLHGDGNKSVADENVWQHKMYAMSEMDKLEHTLRPGFGSWHAKSVERVKILDKELFDIVFKAAGQEISPGL